MYSRICILLALTVPISSRRRLVLRSRFSPHLFAFSLLPIASLLSSYHSPVSPFFPLALVASRRLYNRGSEYRTDVYATKSKNDDNTRGRMRRPECRSSFYDVSRRRLFIEVKRPGLRRKSGRSQNFDVLFEEAALMKSHRSER